MLVYYLDGLLYETGNTSALAMEFRLSCIDLSIYPIVFNNLLIPLSPQTEMALMAKHDDVIKWKHFPRNWPFVRDIHRFPVNFPHKGQWRGALMFSLIYAWINDWVNNHEAGDLRRQHGHYDVIVMDNISIVGASFDSG